jgi:serine phosphatase RsbU (regulator of sigma subunit)
MSGHRIAFSDGESEAMSQTGEEFGDARPLDLPQAGMPVSVEAQVDGIVAAVRDFTKGAAQSDDIAVMAVRRRAEGPSA